MISCLAQHGMAFASRSRQLPAPRPWSSSERVHGVQHDRVLGVQPVLRLLEDLHNGDSTQAQLLTDRRSTHLLPRNLAGIYVAPAQHTSSSARLDQPARISRDCAMEWQRQELQEDRLVVSNAGAHSTMQMLTLLYGASTTESTVSMPRSAGRQCRKMACGPACFIIASLTWKSRNTCDTASLRSSTGQGRDAAALKQADLPHPFAKHACASERKAFERLKYGSGTGSAEEQHHMQLCWQLPRVWWLGLGFGLGFGRVQGRVRAVTHPLPLLRFLLLPHAGPHVGVHHVRALHGVHRVVVHRRRADARRVC